MLTKLRLLRSLRVVHANQVRLFRSLGVSYANQVMLFGSVGWSKSLGVGYAD